jgi:hypothetical protein
MSITTVIQQLTAGRGDGILADLDGPKGLLLLILGLVILAFNRWPRPAVVKQIGGNALYNLLWDVIDFLRTFWLTR